jgi:hypothetical protein
MGKYAAPQQYPVDILHRVVSFWDLGLSKVRTHHKVKAAEFVSSASLNFTRKYHCLQSPPASISNVS